MLESIIGSMFRNYVDSSFSCIKQTEPNNSIDAQISENSAHLDKTALYAHIPFCKSLCPFCSFNRYLFRENQARLYFQMLNKEFEHYVDAGYTFSSLHIGGGTPTVMVNGLVQFIDNVRSAFNIKDIDVESTPMELNDESVAALKSAGVKRLSIGVQTFDDALLKDAGRSGYTGNEAKERIKVAKGQFKTVGIDLMFNFPTQTFDSFHSDIQNFKSLGIEQVTFYPLMPGPHKGTVLEKRFNKSPAPNIFSREKQFYGILLKEFPKKEHHASSAWCFSKKKDSIDEYVFENPEYIGIGSSSVSILNNGVNINTFSLGKYEKYVSGEHFPVTLHAPLSKVQLAQYALLTSLFGLRGNLPAETASLVKKELLYLKMLGIITGSGSEWRVTDKGMYYASTMMREFLSSLNHLREDCIANQI